MPFDSYLVPVLTLLRYYDYYGIRPIFCGWELVHRASAGVEVACILFQNFVNPPWAEETTKSQLFNTYKQGI